MKVKSVQMILKAFLNFREKSQKFIFYMRNVRSRVFKGNERNWFRNLELFRNKKLELLKKTNTFNFREKSQ